MNLIYGSSPTQYTVQQIANLVYGSAFTTLLTFQQILNRNLGQVDDYYTLQQALWHTLQSELSLTGSDTQYSVQELLNMALQAGVPIGDVVGTTSHTGVGGSNFVGMLPVFSLIGP